jgi:hypothetical protein
MNYLIIAIILNLLIINSHANIQDRIIHPYCNNYNKESEFFITCSAYDESKVKVLYENENLNDAVDNSGPNELLIVAYTSKKKPYKIYKSLKLKPGVGLLSSRENKFFYIVPNKTFFFDKTKYFSMVELQGNNKLTGLAIDARDYNEAFIANINNLYAYTTTIYSNNDKDSVISWCSLHGADYINTLIDFKHTQKKLNFNTVSHSWIETSGSASGILISSDNLGSFTDVVIKYSALIISNGKKSGQFKTVALKLNANAVVEYNYFILKKTSNSIQPRILLYIQDAKALSHKLAPYYIKSNYFYSEQEQLRNRDYALKVDADGYNNIKAVISSNMVTDNINTDVSDPNESIGSNIIINGNSKALPLRQAPSWDEFFSNSLKKIHAGICSTPLYAANNLTKTKNVHLTGVPSYNYLCGFPLDRKDFSIKKALDRHYNYQVNSKCPSKFNQLTCSFIAISCIETIAIIAIIVKYISPNKRKK